MIDKKITCQGIFRWVGTAYKRVKKTVKYTDLTRERKLFFALNVPGVSHLTDGEFADTIIIDLILDEGLESEYLITDPQKVVGGFMQPATQKEVTDNPGAVVWLGWVGIPRYARYTEPGEHNISVQAAFRDIDKVGQRIFDDAHGAAVKRYDYEVFDDRPHTPSGE